MIFEQDIWILKRIFEKNGPPLGPGQFSRPKKTVLMTDKIKILQIATSNRSDRYQNQSIFDYFE